MEQQTATTLAPREANPIIKRIAHADAFFGRFLEIFTGALLVLIVLIISWQVLARYLPGVASPHWTEEVSLMLLVWLGLLATGLSIREGENLSVTLFVRQLPTAAQQVIYRFVWLVVTLFGLYLVRFGFDLAQGTMSQNFSTIRIPVGWMYLAMPTGGAIITVYALRNLLSRWTPAEPLPLRTVRPSRARLALRTLAILGLLAFLVTTGPANLLSPTGLLIGAFVLLLLLGTPIGIAVGAAAILAVMRFGMPELIVAQRMANGVTATPLLAIPFFILMGQLMSVGGIANRLIDLARVLVGPWRGGLAMVNVLNSMLLGGVSGSAVADVSATGSVLIPMMKKKGYDAEFSTAITVASSVQGIIVPPSHNMVIYSLAAGGVSIGTMFLAGYLPGIMTGAALMLSAYVIAVRRGYPTEARPPAHQSLRITLGALPSLLIGLIVVGGIVLGWFTATESAAIGVLAALFVSAFFYRELNWARLWAAITASVATVALVIFIIATASAFSWMMALLRIPADLSALILSLSDNPIVILLLINVLLLVLGTIMDMGPLIVILTPVLLPIVTASPINMDPVHFGIVMMLNLGLGLTTPPVGTALFVGCGIGGVTMERVSKTMFYFWPAMIAVLLLVTYVPWFVQIVPRLLGSP